MVRASRHEGRTLVGDLLRYVPSQIVPAVVSLVSIPFLTRLFAPDEFGDYRLVMVTAMVFGAIGGPLAPGVVRFFAVAEKDNSVPLLVATVMRLWFLFSASAALLWAAGLFFPGLGLRPGLRNLMLIGIIMLMGNTLFGVLQAFFRAQRLPIWFSMSTAWRSAVGLVIGIGLVLQTGLGIDGILWGTVAATGVALPIMWRKSLGQFSLRHRMDWRLAREIAAFSSPLMAAALASWALRLSDTYIIGATRDTTEVGIYGAVYGLAEQSIGVLVALFQVAFLPIASRIWEQEGSDRAAGFVSQATRLYILIGMPAVVGISVIGHPLVDLVTGPDYLEGYRIIPFIATAAFVMGMRTWFGSAFQFHRRTLPYTVSLLAGAGVNVGLNLATVPRFGYMAAAINTLIGYLVSIAVMAPWSRTMMTFQFPWMSLVKTAGVSAVMAAAVILVHHVSAPALPAILSLGLAIATGIGIVLLGLVALKEVNFREVRKSFRW